MWAVKLLVKNYCIFEWVGLNSIFTEGFFVGTVRQHSVKFAFNSTYDDFISFGNGAVLGLLGNGNKIEFSLPYTLTIADIHLNHFAKLLAILDRLDNGRLQIRQLFFIIE